MGQPEWIRTLPCHEIEDKSVISGGEQNWRSGAGDSVDCIIIFFAAVMPLKSVLITILYSILEHE